MRSGFLQQCDDLFALHARKTFKKLLDRISCFQMIEEALRRHPRARKHWLASKHLDYEGVPARVVRAEHLIAICLQTGRAKDRARVAMLREQVHLDLNFLADMLKRHQLEDKWKLWTE